MEIRRLDDARQDAPAITELMEAVVGVDAPWVHPMTADDRAVFLEQGWDGEPPLVYLGEIEGRLVAVGQLELPERDNTHLAWLQVEVHPEFRRQGLGTQMFQHVHDLARAAGRSSLGIDGWEVEPALAFAEKFGFERKSQSVQRRMYPPKVDQELLAKQHAEAADVASDYELLRVPGRTPDDLLDRVVEITAAINDAPTDDLDIEDEVFSVERLRAYEDSNEKRGRPYTVYARHRESGQLAGKTVVLVERKRPQWGHQHDTSVVAEHRGHRLGLLLKADMLQWLAEEEPQLEQIDTWNAESNDHMIGVNEQLGYVVMGRALEFQRPV